MYVLCLCLSIARYQPRGVLLRPFLAISIYSSRTKVPPAPRTPVWTTYISEVPYKVYPRTTVLGLVVGGR